MEAAARDASAATLAPVGTAPATSTTAALAAVSLASGLTTRRSHRERAIESARVACARVPRPVLGIHRVSQARVRCWAYTESRRRRHGWIYDEGSGSARARARAAHGAWRHGGRGLAASLPTRPRCRRGRPARGSTRGLRSRCHRAAAAPRRPCRSCGERGGTQQSRGCGSSRSSSRGGDRRRKRTKLRQGRLPQGGGAAAEAAYRPLDADGSARVRVWGYLGWLGFGFGVTWIGSGSGLRLLGPARVR
eukprot:2959937-Prymnesium_polylepis.1